MSLVENLMRRFGYVKSGRGGRSGYSAAEVSRLTSSLATEAQFINTTLRYQLRALRARSRQAAQNNPYVKRFVNMVVNNVCGAKPFKLEGKVSYGSGRLDTAANDRIETAWTSWGKKGNCEVTGQWSWSAVQRQLVRSLATDGELLLRKLTGPEYGPFAFQLQVIDIDRLPETKNATLSNGGAIHSGIEFDAVGRPVAYHVLKRKPSAWQWNAYGTETERYPASEMVHIFVPDFAEQCRGVPWIYAALLNLVHLGAFEEAAVIAARIGASQMGIITADDEGAALAQVQDPARTGKPEITAEPGTFPVLPSGYKFESWDPKYPDAAVGPFIKAMLHGVAAGLDVAYHNLSADLEGVNYSSARIGELDERDFWESTQGFLVDHLHQPLYEHWLREQMITGRIAGVDLAKFDKYTNVLWQPRRWAWVDPLKEVGAAIEAINSGIKSRTRVVAEMGEDFEDVLEEIKTENELAASLGVTLSNAAPGAKPDAAATDPGGTGSDAAAGQGKQQKIAPVHDASIARIARIHELTR